MHSSLTWVDHDPAARERSLRILALFNCPESRDELGIGGIRDSISDTLFPGVSTVQTRLRYFLFVPWIFEVVAKEGHKGETFLKHARRREIQLAAVLAAQEDNDGAFGKSAGAALKILPSRIYWPGLETWGIRRHSGSIERFSLDAASISRQLRAHVSRVEEEPVTPLMAWDPGLPQAPDDFPASASFRLTESEAAFIRDCWARSARDTYLAHLALSSGHVDCAFPWEHPALADASDAHRFVLQEARLFSQLINGGSLLYNYELAKLRGSDEWTERYAALLGKWRDEFPREELNRWSLDGLRQIVAHSAHRVGQPTWDFVSEWLSMALESDGEVASSPSAVTLVRRREAMLKKARSRFTNPQALAQWGGESGVARLDFRWATVSRFLADMSLIGSADA